MLACVSPVISTLRSLAVHRLHNCAPFSFCVTFTTQLNDETETFLLVCCSNTVHNLLRYMTGSTLMPSPPVCLLPSLPLTTDDPQLWAFRLMGLKNLLPKFSRHLFNLLATRLLCHIDFRQMSHSLPVLVHARNKQNHLFVKTTLSRKLIMKILVH